MITVRAVERAIRNAALALHEAHNDSAKDAKDLLDVTNDAKRIAIELYEYLCKFQGQEEA